MKRSLFVAVLSSIICGVLWIFFLAATDRAPVLDADTMNYVEGGAIAVRAKSYAVAPFYIDKYEVTNAQFKKFKPVHQFPAEEADHPVTNVTWEEATAYAAWAGKRLPSAKEWEVAAGAADGRSYPSGRRITLSKNSEVRRVGALSEYRSPYGCFDMESNVWEWTATGLDSSSRVASSCRILKGGCFEVEGKLVASKIGQQLVLPADRASSRVGFRCARDPQNVTNLERFSAK